MPDARLLLLAAIVVLAAVTPGTASADGLETLLMPGRVASAHAKLEQDCAQCHDRADRGRQAALCLHCHEEVAADVRSHSGFHGRLRAIGSGQCRACHSEHLGRDADIVKLKRASFDHAQTDFRLDGAHTAADCGACHRAGRKFREATSRCVDCHLAVDPHAGRLGAACVDCHDSSSWANARFDHARTRFPLRDAHREVACAACHPGNRYSDTPATCVACHAPDDVHDGSRGPDCADCHTSTAWKTSRFDHAKEARFPLTGAHARVDCRGCHVTPNVKDPLPRDCSGCHRADDAHASRFGAACEKCHGTSAWTPATFDHAHDGHFELAGRHAELRCTACHTAVVTSQKLGTDCHACHRTDDVHAGHLGTDCARCHGVAGWRADVAFDHDLAPFPLVGLHVAVPCQACHAAPAFKGTAQACIACHVRDDRHRGTLGKDCESCHSPTGWSLWEFDHGKATRFALTGRHADLACADCHRQPPGSVKLAGDCAACHSRDDVHLGQYGRSCERCHGTSTFKGARLQQGAR